jgi:hypothetical protein
LIPPRSRATENSEPVIDMRMRQASSAAAAATGGAARPGPAYPTSMSDLGSDHKVGYHEV